MFLQLCMQLCDRTGFKVMIYNAVNITAEPLQIIKMTIKTLKALFLQLVSFWKLMTLSRSNI